MPTSTQHDGRDLPRDLTKTLDRRLKTFTFTAIPPKLEEWKGGSIVNDVFDAEYNVNKNFKSNEDKLIWRMETWIDKCRIEEYDDKGALLNNGTGKFHSAKRFRKPTLAESGLAKVRSFSLGRHFSKSSENINRLAVNIDTTTDNRGDEFITTTESKSSAKMASSRSTSNLLDETDRSRRDASLDRRSVKSMEVFSRQQQRSPTKQKTPNKFFSFAGKIKSGVKGNSDKKKEKLKRHSFGYDLDEESENNNGPVQSHTSKVRPSVLDIVSTFGGRNNNKRNEKLQRDGSGGERRCHTIARSTSVGGKPSPSPDFQNSKTLFKTRNHNDSVKRVKTKVKASYIAGPEGGRFSGPVFFDPEARESPVQTEIGDV